MIISTTNQEIPGQHQHKKFRTRTSHNNYENAVATPDAATATIDNDGDYDDDDKDTDNDNGDDDVAVQHESTIRRANSFTKYDETGSANDDNNDVAASTFDKISVAA